ncbi:hypothetical protein [Riemerella columbina]|uniref:exodeoxyribonuclease X C-terminal domain-containing protein n=1 Tax=Riemerella columbina TaxID=103810 RepID=UPI00266F21CA|nr:hypothetical protein [Riemerella columbina]WKS95818.1 hypothetical protein NYR17_03525 [Riemerella columbina]
MKYKIYGINTPIEFGRYKGKTLLEVAKEDKNYLEWFIEEIDNVSVDGELLNYKEIQALGNIHILEDRLSVEEELYEDFEEDYVNYDWSYDDYRYYSDREMWSDIAGTDDPDVINDVYWNLD